MGNKPTVNHKGGNGYDIYLVDPNPPGNTIPDVEDMFIYVDFRTITRGRSIIETSNTGEFDLRNESDEHVISFIGTKNINGVEQVTTDWTDIGGKIENNNRTSEGFGIKDINIEYGADLVPKVVINFVDVRGGAMFDGYSDIDPKTGQQVNTSKYSVFFKMPYPLFRLTVKGYYGKAVSYCLHMKKWNGSFNSDTGNFEITAEFIGFTFAFLADILMGHVMGVTNTELGRSKLEKYGMKPIDNLITDSNSIGILTERFKDKCEDCNLIDIFKEAKNKLKEVEEKIGRPIMVNFPNKIDGDLISHDKIDNKQQYFIRDLGIFNSNISDDYKKFVDDVNELVKQYDEYIEKNNQSNYKLFNLDIGIDFDQIILMDELIEKINNDEPKFRLDDEADIVLDVNNLPDEEIFKSNKNVLVKDYHQDRKKISRLIKNIDDNLETLSKKANENFRIFLTESSEGLGYNPTIKNIFEVLCYNIEVFLECIYDISLNAEQKGAVRLKDLNLDNTDINKQGKKIYPWPLVYDTNEGEELWIGDVVGEDNINFPEIGFINDIYESLIMSIENRIVEGAKIESIVNDVDKDDWFPINPIDISENPYLGLNSLTNLPKDNLPIELYQPLLERSIISYDYSKYNSDNQTNLISILESSNCFGNIVNPTIKKYINNVEGFTTSLINSGIDGGVIKEEGDYYVLDSETISVNDYKVSGLRSNNDATYILVDNYGVINNKVNLSNTIESTIKGYDIDGTFITNNDITSDKIIENGTIVFDRELYTKGKDLSFVVWVDDINSFIFNKINKSDEPKLNTKQNFIEISVKDIDGVIGDDRTKYINNVLDPTSFITKTLSLTTTEFFSGNTNEQSKALLFLNTLPFKKFGEVIDRIKNTALNVKLPELYLVWVGGLLWRSSEIEKNNIDPITWSNGFQPPNMTGSNPKDLYINTIGLKKDEIYGNDIKIEEELLSLPQQSKNEMINFFLSWVRDVWVSKGMVDILNSYHSPTKNDNKSDLDLSRLINNTVFFTSLTPRIWDLTINDKLKIPKTVLENVIGLFHTNFRQLFKDNNPDDNLRKQAKEQLLKGGTDKDIKLQMYRYYKNIYDKWVAGGNTGGKVFNLCGGSSGDLLDYFQFVDRSWNNIGDLAVLNLNSISILSKNYDISFYDFIGRILRDSYFDFHVLPNFVNFRNPNEVSEMFQTFDYLVRSDENNDTNIISGPSFVCMYSTGNSKLLDIGNNFEYNNDGFDFNDDLSDLNKKLYKENKNGVGITAFRVAFGDDNQSIFKKVNLNQEEYRETDESLRLQSELFDRVGGTQRIHKGVNLFNVYSVRSYTCEVEAMGNMLIQPLMYFQLDNVPMFHGAYLIEKVTHTITPHNINTNFKGVRQSKIYVPIVNDITTFINIPFDITLEKDGRTLTSGVNIVNDSSGIDPGGFIGVDIIEDKDFSDEDNIFIQIP